MYAIATRPVAGSVPIAGRTAFCARVTATGALHCTPSGDVATNTALLRDEPGDSQSCQVAHTRPVRSTSAEGRENARKSGIRQPPSTAAMRTGAPHVAPPSAEHEAAMEKQPPCR